MAKRKPLVKKQKVLFVKISDILIPEQPIPEAKSKEIQSEIYLANLRAKIIKFGMRQPIELLVGENDKYILYHGFWRLMIMKDLGQTHIHAIICDLNQKGE